MYVNHHVYDLDIVFFHIRPYNPSLAHISDPLVEHTELSTQGKYKKQWQVADTKAIQLTYDVLSNSYVGEDGRKGNQRQPSWHLEICRVSYRNPTYWSFPIMRRIEKKRLGTADIVPLYQV